MLLDVQLGLLTGVVTVEFMRKSGVDLPVRALSDSLHDLATSDIRVHRVCEHTT